MNMDSTYSICTQCHKLNKAQLQRILIDRPVCDSCKAELPINGFINKLDTSSLKALIEKSPLLVVVDFFAPWCQPCKIFEPVFNEVAHQLSGKAVFSKIDTQAHPLAGDLFQIRSIPTVVLFQEGVERMRQTGAMSSQLLTKWIMSYTRSVAA
jgi:thioredoxin 2